MNMTNPLSPKPDQRYKFAKLQILIADHDQRSAQMVKQILIAFGFRKINIVSTGEEALNVLKSARTDLLVCEWSLDGVDGLTLVRAIRGAKNHVFLQHDLPILMLTGHAGRVNVQGARDAGITEFVAKPFSAKTISTRLIEIIDNPRVFVEAPNYKGPSRRRNQGPPIGVDDRRIPREQRERMVDAAKVTITRANFALRDMVDGVSAADVITADVLEEAQAEVTKSAEQFVAWVKSDLETLDAAYQMLVENSADKKARTVLLNTAYVIKSQSGVFGYELGTVVADLLCSYLSEHKVFAENNLMVISKHIDTLGVIFNQKIKEADGPVGMALIGSLSKLVAKFA